MPFKDLQPVQSTLALVVMPPKTPKIKTIYGRRIKRIFCADSFGEKRCPRHPQIKSVYLIFYFA